MTTDAKQGKSKQTTNPGDERMPKSAKSAKTAKTAKRIGGVYLHGRVYYAQWMANGRKYKVNTRKTDRDEALAELDRLTQPFLLGDEAEIAKVLAQRAADKYDRLPALRVADIWSEIEKTVKYRDWATETVKRNRTHVAKFVEWMAKNHPQTIEVRDVTVEQARDFVVHILESNKAKTAIEYRSMLLQAWNMVSGASRASSNPWVSVERPVNRSERRRELTLGELRTIFGSLSGEMRTLFAVGLYTGLRLGDAVTLEWSAVDLKTRTIKAKPAKTERYGTEVVVSIAGTGLETILNSVPVKKRKGWIMPELAEKYRATPTGNGGFGKMIQKVFTDAGIETSHDTGKGRRTVDVGFHSLRHSFVSLSANAGVPLSVVQSIVGHTNPAMTQHYYHATRMALENAAKALPDVLGGDGAGDAENAVHGALDALCGGWTDDEIEQAVGHLQEVLRRRRG